MTLDVHQQFPFVGVGNTQSIFAVGESFTLLVAVPTLPFNPACAFSGKNQHGSCDRRAGKDSVSRPEVGFHIGIGNIDRGNCLCRYLADGLERTAASLLPPMAPGVEILVVTVTDQALRRDDAYIHFVAPTIPGSNLDLPARQQGIGDSREKARLNLALAQR